MIPYTVGGKPIQKRQNEIVLSFLFLENLEKA